MTLAKLTAVCYLSTSLPVAAHSFKGLVSILCGLKKGEMLMIPFKLMPFLLRSSNAPAGVRLAVRLFFFTPLAHNVLTHINAERLGGADAVGRLL